ncbi:MAG: hypothetical protein AAF718_05610 [Pseudomonadota bacterium]
MRITFLSILVLLAGCAQIPDFRPAPPPAPAPNIDPSTGLALPDDNAVTVEDFDTTTDEQREEATVAPSTGGDSLGTTVASLGDAAIPGFWLETPLVTVPTVGRVRNPDTGRIVQVDLRPITGGSSRISLAALRLLEAPLTGLVTLEVFLNT